MNVATRRLVTVVIGLSALSACAQTTAQTGTAAPENGAPWASDFDVEPAHLASVGRNPYFILEPGYVVVLKDDAGDQLTITVLDETKVVDGVETRIIEERELAKGKLIEVSRNYFAIHKVSKDAFYFGEQVSMYKNGKVVSREGSWLAGVDGAKAGVIMPGDPKAGFRYYQEQAKGIAMDRAEILSTEETIETPAGRLDHCLKVEETNALKANELEYKYYAPGVGLVKEDQMLLVEHGPRPAKGAAKK